ncbi:hydantoinase B/oxoprolinase family protein [Bradyrhizobium commune]|uniref:hydantoinase B/oxoprolinase family protein n=1 Tax=Bradyrhizobium commune TaxID=83627 RepID=UPI001FEF59BE|nr:hydantoinase B/oxoprolinase family protein [Bradyrhizobium commune]
MAGPRSAGGIKFGSIEVAEARFPLHFRHHEYLADSGGVGQFRGGLGVALDLVVQTEKPAPANTAGEGVRHGACGLLGGNDGAPHRYGLVSPGPTATGAATKEVGVEVVPGDCFEVRSSGSGGWGPPESVRSRRGETTACSVFTAVTGETGSYQRTFFQRGCGSSMPDETPGE